MDISSVGPTPTSGGQTAASSTKQTLGKEEFLRLLVTQISNQNPLDPMDGTQFVEQLATFSNLEQLTNVNAGLEQIAAGQAGLLQGQTVGLVGRTAVFPGNQLDLLSSGSTPIHYELPADAGALTIEVLDGNGDVVATFPGKKLTGLSEVPFDGIGKDGERLPAGRYSYRITATATDGTSMAATTYSTAKVDGITYESGRPQLMAGDDRIDPADVLRVLD